MDKQPKDNPEALASEIRMDGVGEDKAIQDLVSDEFLTADDMQAASIAAGVARILRGELDEKFERQLNRYMEWSEKRMKEERKFNEDRLAWMENLIEKGNSQRAVTAEDKARVSISAAEAAQRAREAVVAESAHAILKFKEKVAKAPKVTVTSYGKPYRSRSGFKTEPETIAMVVGTKTFGWTLPVGVPTELPDFIAEEYSRRKREDVKLDELKTDLSVENIQDFDKVAAKHPEIDYRRGQNTQSGQDFMSMAEAERIKEK